MATDDIPKDKITIGGEEALAIWREGRKAWNHWVKENPVADVDFRYVDFSKERTKKHNLITFEYFNFPKGEVRFDEATFGKGYVNFRSVQFGDGNVSFKRATFDGGDLNFSLVTFGKGDVDFGEANFGDGGVNFYDASFDKGDVNFGISIFGKGYINFDKATFGKGIVEFGKADLSQISSVTGYLPNPTLKQTIFRSRKALNNLEGLTEEQIQSAIFQDEIDLNEARQKKSRRQSKDAQLVPLLRITLEGDFCLSPLNQARLFGNIQIAYNFLFYLLTTTDKVKKEDIDSVFTGNKWMTLIGAEEDILVNSIVLGSQIVDLAGAIDALGKASNQHPVLTTLLAFGLTVTAFTDAYVNLDKGLSEATKLRAEAAKLSAETDKTVTEIELLKLQVASKKFDLNQKMKNSKETPKGVSALTGADSQDVLCAMQVYQCELEPIILKALANANIKFKNPIIREKQYNYITQATAPLVSTLNYFTDLGLTGYSFEMKNMDCN